MLSQFLYDKTVDVGKLYKLLIGQPNYYKQYDNDALGERQDD